jgi:hypothetical protein
MFPEMINTEASNQSPLRYYVTREFSRRKATVELSF